MEDHVTGEADPLLDPVIKSYYDANVNLVRTIGIKSVWSPELLNEFLIEQYGLSTINRLYRETWKLEESEWRDNPKTWKYYLNLAGEYHPTDTVMQITSLDTQEVIDFTKVNLASHPTTKTAYKYGTRYYQTLVNRFPDQEDLIMGIIMPCDIDVAIAAEEGTILRYDTSLVEEYEYTLIKDLEDWIKRHIFRWYIDAQRVSQEYYLMTYYNELYLKMIPALMIYRDRRRQTYEVHSFHVRMFLKGFMELDKYYPFLTREQAMYLYRNLPRLVRYMGHDVQFNELKDKLLTKRNIPIFGYDIRQKNEIDASFHPTAVARAELLNDISSVIDVETISLTELFDKEKSGLYGTADFYDAKQSDVIFKVQNTRHAKMITKDIITQVPDNANIATLNFEDFVLQHWAFMSKSGLYNATVSFRNPRTGGMHQISSKNAFVYMYYLVLSYAAEDMFTDIVSGLGSEAANAMQQDATTLLGYERAKTARPITRIPHFVATHTVAMPKPTLEELLNLIPLTRREALTEVAQGLLDAYIPLTAVGSTVSFYELCLTIYKNYLVQYNTTSLEDAILDKGHIRNMVYRLYQDMEIEFFEPSAQINDPVQFCAQNNLDTYTVAKENLVVLVNNIYEAGTGISVNTSSSQKYIVRSMLSILRALSSYNVQFIDIINEVDLTSLRVSPNDIHGYMSFENGNPNGMLEHVSNIPMSVYVMDTEVTIDP